jgi:large subunit ribosomal protein L3
MQGLIGRKLGMTQVYDADGNRVAATVIEVGPCAVVQRKTKAADGYDAVQLGYLEIKESRTSKPAMGAFRKGGVTPRRVMREFRLDEGDDPKAGDAVSVAIFEGIGYVDVTGVSKGRGFAGVVRRYRMAGGPLTHGGHSKRRVGSIGQNSFPARVMRGKRMPGHMGHVRVTQQNLRVVAVRPEDNAIVVQGAVPGPTGGIVLVRKALKKAVKG